MYLAAGLGNPGDQYKMTRHNIGFEVIDYMARENKVKIKKLKFKGIYGEMNICGEKLILLKPQTYMNLSGESVSQYCSFFKIPPEKVIIICDDISLPAGKIRIRTKGSAGGHNGLKSIIQCLSSDAFMRIKIGVGAPENEGYDLADYVLGRFTKDEIPVLEKSIINSASAVREIITAGAESAMNKFN